MSYDDPVSPSEEDGRHADKASALYQMQFGLASDELLHASFACALQQGVLRQGRLSVSQHYACFHASIPLLGETTLVLRCDAIAEVELARVMLFPTAIRLTMRDGASHLFASFMAREQAYQLLQKVAKGERIGVQAVKSSEELDAREHRAHSSAAASSAADSKPRHQQLLEARAGKLKQHAVDGDDEAEVKPKARKSRPKPKPEPEEEPEEPQDEPEEEEEDAVMAAFKKPSRKAAAASAANGDGAASRPKPSASARRTQKDDPSPHPSRPSTPDGVSETPKRKGSKQPAAEVAASAASAAAAAGSSSSKPKRSSAGQAGDSLAAPAPAPNGRKPSPRGGDSDATNNGDGGKPAAASARRRPDPAATPPESRDNSGDEAAALAAPKERGSKKSAAHASSSSASSVATATPTLSSRGRPRRFPNDSSSDDDEPLDAEFGRHCSLYDAFKPHALPDPLVTAISRRFRSGSLTSALDTRNRRLVHQGFVRRQGGLSVVDRWMFLFTDSLVLAKIVPGANAGAGGTLEGYELKQTVDLLNIVAVDARPPSAQKAHAPESVGSAFDSVNSTRMSNAFRIVVRDKPGGSGETTYVVGVGTPREKRAWEQWILFAVARQMKHTGHPVVVAAAAAAAAASAAGASDSPDSLSSTSASSASAASPSPSLAVVDPMRFEDPPWFLRTVLGTVWHASWNEDLATLKALASSPASSAAEDDPPASLLDARLDRVDGSTGLLYAAQGNRLASLGALLELGADQTVLDRRGQGAFHRAARGGYVAAISLLVADAKEKNLGYAPLIHPAPPSASRRRPRFLSSSSAMWVAAQSRAREWEGSLRSMVSLVPPAAVKAVLDDRDASGTSLLDLSVVAGSERLAQVLVDLGASLDAFSPTGQTALGRAVGQGSEGMVRLLLSLGAQPHARPEAGVAAAIHYAPNRATAALMIELGGRFKMSCSAGGDNVRRLVDHFGDSERAQAALDHALEVADARPVLVTSQTLRNPTASHASAEACAICRDDFSSISAGRYKEYCGVCLKSVCASCSSRRLAFPLASNKRGSAVVQQALPAKSAAGGSSSFAPMEARDAHRQLHRVCEGCYNHFAARTVQAREDAAYAREKRKRRARASARKTADGDVEDDDLAQDTGAEDEADGAIYRGVEAPVVSAASNSAASVAANAVGSLLGFVGVKNAKYLGSEGSTLSDGFSRLGSMLTSVHVSAPKPAPPVVTPAKHSRTGSVAPSIDGPAAAITAGGVLSKPTRNQNASSTPAASTRKPAAAAVAAASDADDEPPAKPDAARVKSSGRFALALKPRTATKKSQRKEESESEESDEATDDDDD